MANLPPVLRQRYFDANGNPLAGGKLYTYQAGTSTPQETYTDQTAATPNANPIVLDANGECAMWLNPSYSYKFILKDSSDVSQWTIDNVVGLLGTDAVVTASIANLAVTAPKLADDAVTADKLRDSASVDADRAVTTNHVRDSAITTAKIADSGVTTAKIADSNVTTAKLNDGAVTQAKRAALGQQLSSSCGAFTTQMQAATDVTNLSVTITTTGRPVSIRMIPDGSGNTSYVFAGSAVSPQGRIQFRRDSTTIADWPLVTSGTEVGEFAMLDIPATGTYTYKVRVWTEGGVGGASNRIDVNYFKLLAFEL